MYTCPLKLCMCVYVYLYVYIYMFIYVGCFVLFNTGTQVVRSKAGLLTTVAYQLGPNKVCMIGDSVSIYIATY